MPRYHCPIPLHIGSELDLPAGAARHVQVLRHQPGDVITLFEGQTGNGFAGGEFDAVITHMGRSDVGVRIQAHRAVEREAERAVHLVVGMPANERMDWLVEKATELGVASIQPVMAARSVLKLKGDRADKKIERWQSIAVSACEQCGRNQVPVIHAPRPLADWLRSQDAPDAESARFVLSLREGSQPLRTVTSDAKAVWVLHGPEGGLTAQEEDWALERGWKPASLGNRVLRAETASVAALSLLALE
ncbi:16S rRNA (uracil(1498)-N(3))-methyltransferase [Comamonas resistens]|uniref:Ribosomal RNA small subunit methyltransferase E n=1 Tax=Comamonas resistens TaxID=3046670 RepID=A0ABY8SUA7_9BURK|nr:16S rRNA (uracil(1498)-N(3))-methyltransferase [Comamonas resistens]MDL5037360.1 16S rRNA (uracil(1498)-N(3))-methyltransferase [Comamonas resistens]WHS65494.1 16S rRNA (uracil(1498)-N(3))-methyltransferase [Comamonas resistens]